MRQGTAVEGRCGDFAELGRMLCGWSRACEYWAGEALVGVLLASEVLCAGRATICFLFHKNLGLSDAGMRYKDCESEYLTMERTTDAALDVYLVTVGCD